jgi:hypothetical protein
VFEEGWTPVLGCRMHLVQRAMQHACIMGHPIMPNKLWGTLSSMHGCAALCCAIWILQPVLHLARPCTHQVSCTPMSYLHTRAWSHASGSVTVCPVLPGVLCCAAGVHFQAADVC